MRIGVVNWDAAVGENTYFGGYMHRVLAKESYRDRLAFFARQEADGYRIPLRSQREYDRELSYAKEGGIDYFAYCRYPDGRGARFIGMDREEYRFLAPHLGELNFASKKYRSSTLRDKIGNCAILFSCHAYGEEDLRLLAEDMARESYERIADKPLIYLYGGYDEAFLSCLREYYLSCGEEIYVVLMGRTAQSGQSYSLVDAVSGYSSCHAAADFSELSRYAAEDNDRRLSYCLPVIPLLSLGWNPSPRIDEPCPWGTYRKLPYALAPRPEEVQECLWVAKHFLDTAPEWAKTDHALVFAWNEFEEGAFLCPTLGEDGKPDERVLRAFGTFRKQILENVE